MKMLDMSERAGSEAKASEDRVGFCGNLAWVIDGASDFTNESSLSGLSNVHWLVDYIQERFTYYGDNNIHYNPMELVENLLHDVRRELENYDLSSLKNYPCCSIGLVITSGSEIKLARVGDATVVARHRDGSCVEISTSFFDRREENAVREAKAESLAQKKIIEDMFKRRTDYIMGTYGESVFSGHPSANLHVYSRTLRLEDVSSVLACTDGLSRAINDYKLFSGWSELISAAQGGGLRNLIGLIRSHESQGELVKDSERFKKSDDIAVILLGEN